MSTPNPGTGYDHRHSDPLYKELHETPEFAELKRKFIRFVLPATVIFMTWYLLYVIMSNWAHDFMSIRVVGHINVALIFGLLQFVSTFVIAWMYGKYMNREVDPVAVKLLERYNTPGGGAR